jgi:hypothetical protein
MLRDLIIEFFKELDLEFDLDFDWDLGFGFIIDLYSTFTLFYYNKI